MHLPKKIKEWLFISPFTWSQDPVQTGGDLRRSPAPIRAWSPQGWKQPWLHRWVVLVAPSWASCVSACAAASCPPAIHLCEEPGCVSSIPPCGARDAPKPAPPAAWTSPSPAASWWPSAELSHVYQLLSCTWCPKMDAQLQSRGKQSPPLIYCLCPCSYSPRCHRPSLLPVSDVNHIKIQKWVTGLANKMQNFNRKSEVETASLKHLSIPPPHPAIPLPLIL